MDPNSSKRRKIATTCSLGDFLPGGILAEVAKFLAPTSRILFAITVTPSPSPYDTIMARCKPKVSHWSIAGDNWDTLDFGDIEKELAAKLTDIHISRVLLHIDAARNLKTLRLTNCVNITGAGLGSLRSSTSIEHIDMGLVAPHQSPKLNPVPPFSRDEVLPILEDIIRLERNSLKFLQFPHEWRLNGEEHLQFESFLDEFNDMMRNNRTAIKCESERCNRGFKCYMDTEIGSVEDANQDHTCSVCFCADNYCYRCRGPDRSHIHFCYKCERNYCSKCSPSWEECATCEIMYCVKCFPRNYCANLHCAGSFCNDCRSDRACGLCGKAWCRDCDSYCMQCSGCWQRCCGRCSAKEGVNGVQQCDYCDERRCDQCRIITCQKGDNECPVCINMIPPSLLLEKTKSLQAANKDLKESNVKMKQRIKVLRKENVTIKQRNEDLEEENDKMKTKLSAIRSYAQL